MHNHTYPMEKRDIFTAVGLVAVFTIVATVLAVTVSARVPSYAVKGIVLDKSTADNWFELRVTEQSKGKTDIRGDQLIVRVLSTTKTSNKNNKELSVASWLSKVQNNDIVSIAGEYKTTDGTIWSDRVLNRTR